MLQKAINDIGLQLIIPALVIVCVAGLFLPQINETGQLAVLLGLMLLLVTAVCAVSRHTLNPAWVFVLACYLELVALLIWSVKPGQTILWLVLVVPFPFVVITLVRQPGLILPALADLWPWLLLVGFAFLSVYWSANPEYGMEKALLFLLRGLVPGIYILLLCRANQSFSWQLVLIISIIYSIVLLTFGTEAQEYPGRIALPEGNPILAARVCLVGAVVALWHQNSSVLLRGAGLLICIFAALETQSRGPLVAFIGAGVITASVIYSMEMLKDRLTWKKIFAFIFILTLLIGSLVTMNLVTTEIDFGERFNALTGKQALMSDQNFSHRLQMYSEAVQLFLKQPLFGAGLGSFEHYGSYPYPHNLVLEIAAEMGLVGLLLWAYAILKVMVRAAHHSLLLCLCILTILVTLSTADFGFNSEYILVSMIALGLLTKGNRHEQQP